MGIGIVLLFWGVVGLVGATIGSVVLPGIVSGFTNRPAEDCRRLIRTTRLFPFACLGWAAGVFVFYAAVEGIVFHQDPGIGDGWTCRLPNGYAIEMIDVTDQGFLYDPKTQDINSGEALSGVRVLQLAGQYILGGIDRESIDHIGYRQGPIDSYFLLDTRTRQRTDFPTYDALRDTASKLSIPLRLERIDVLYWRYRVTWSTRWPPLGCSALRSAVRGCSSDGRCGYEGPELRGRSGLEP
jgi:hypothetical protein